MQLIAMGYIATDRCIMLHSYLHIATIAVAMDTIAVAMDTIAVAMDTIAVAMDMY